MWNLSENENHSRVQRGTESGILGKLIFVSEDYEG